MEELPRKILALVPNWLGDAAMCTPALRALHTRFPEAELTVAGRSASCALLRGLPWIARAISFPGGPGALDAFGVARRLRPHAAGLAVVLPHSFRAAWLARLAGSRRRVGYHRGGRSLLLTDVIEPYRENGVIRPIYMAQEYIDLVKCLGCEDDGKGLELRADPAVVQAVKSRLEGHGPVVGLAPGGAFGPSKRWPAERYAQVADTLSERTGCTCVLLTGPGEEETEEAVRAHAKTPLLRCDDGKPSLETLKATIAQLDLLVCNDSGPRHVAVAFEVPTVCIMGSTSPRYSEGPYEKGRVVRVDVDCGPCQKPVCETDHRCMTQITTGQVVSEALEVLAT